MLAAARLGVAYFAFIFALGLIVGVIRELILEPAFGALPAMLIELPLMLGASWLLCRDALARAALPPALGAGIVMGAVAFALLMAVELAIALWTPGRTVGEYLQTFRSPAALLGLAGQVAFACFPALQIALRTSVVRRSAAQ
jgi:hypothetical protein